MKVGIFHEPTGGIGGSKFVTAIMADTLRDRHEVEIVHHRHNFTVEQLESFFSLDLAGVKSRFVPPPSASPLYSRKYLPFAHRYWRQWNAEVSRSYELFIANVHAIPPYCHCRHGALFINFPAFARSRAWPWGQSTHGRISRLFDPLRRFVYESGWRERMETYQLRLVNSAYTARWTEKYWGIKTDVLYPPVLLDAGEGPKVNAIVSLARFTPSKQQAELLDAFVRHIEPSAAGWELVFVGGLSDKGEDVSYYANLQIAARGRAVRFVPNASRTQLRSELSRAKIFWHAMGLGVDANLEPNNYEHFGIAPVEAMAAGCVPVVLDIGGPAEIVIHGRSGFTCNSLDQMTERIIGLVKDDVLLGKLSIQARIRANDFSVDRFKKKFLSMLASILETSTKA